MSPKDTLRSHGLRATPKRVALLSVLKKVRRPLRVEELHARIRSMDLVTIYRNMQDFTHAGLVQEVRFKDASVRYELFHGHHHHHIVCTACGTIEELASCEHSLLEREAQQASEKFAHVQEHTLEFFGLCKTCA